METFESNRGLLAEIRRLQGLVVARKEALQDIESYVEGMLEAHAHKVKKQVREEAYLIAIIGLENVFTMVRPGLIGKKVKPK